MTGQINVNKIVPRTGTGVAIPGHVIQVVSSDFTDVATGTGTTPVAVSYTHLRAHET